MRITDRHARFTHLRALLIALTLVLAPLLALSHITPVLAATTTCTPNGAVQNCTVTFAFTGAPETWTVPAGVTKATFELYGASGGGSSRPQGRHMLATLTVTPGDSYQIRVGGRNGYNGGGRGSVRSTYGGNGGGASDVRSGAFGLDDRLLVAGGAGGSTYYPRDGSTSRGGMPGYPNGEAGEASPRAGGGGGGTQNGGGAGGAGGGQAGSKGQGGAGGSAANFSGGGGGGGYYGGGGGGSGSGLGGAGGGGSSYATPAATNVSYERRSLVVRTDGLVIISYVIDTTAPVATPTHTPAPAPSGWNNGPVTVTWNWVDPTGGSGLDPANCTTSSVATGSARVTVTATCRDLAGNVGSATYQVLIDPTAPVAHPSQSPAANAAGWNTTDVTVNWNWASTGAVIDTANCTNSLTSSGEGTLTLSATCADVATNQRTVPYTVKVDTTAPSTSESASVSGEQATVTLNTSDALSGVASTSYRVDGGAPQTYTGPFTVTGVGTHTVTFFSVDVAGNQEAERSTTFEIAAPTPVITNTPTATNTPT